MDSAILEILELEKRSLELERQRREGVISYEKAFDMLRGEVRKAIRNLPTQQSGQRRFARFPG